MVNVRLPARWTSRLPRHPQRLLLLAAVLLLFFGLAVTSLSLSPAAWWGNPPLQRVIIAPGSNAGGIARQLEAAGLIRSSAAFRLAGRLTGASSAMRAGVYDFSPRESALQILQRLRQGDSVDLSIGVTIPEGYTVKQIAQTLEAHDICSAQDFLDYLETAELPFDFLDQQAAKVPTARRFEGYLFPDTYRLLPETSPQEVVQVMTGRFRQVIESLLPAAVLQGGNTSDLPVPMNLQQLVTLASIIEREALLDDERATIAGVFYNRLEIKQALQSCATVQYILESNKAVLSTADTQIESPYNTYKYSGLPPGPIAAPGLPSLQAALQPEANEYFYFYAIPGGQGQHVFSRTYAEHNQAIRNLRQK